MRPTVHDIAEKANVSLATVDRVLNNRPGVRAKTREHVEKVIAEIGYERDLAAANLAKKRNYVFDFILPDNDNSFMALMREAVTRAKETWRRDRVAINSRQVHAFDANSLIDQIKAAIESQSDGIAMVAVDDDGVRLAVNEAKAAGIPVVTVVSDLPGSSCIHYAGIDNIAAGRTAASLLGRFMGNQTGAVGVIAGSLIVRDHRERLAGFEEVMSREFSGFNVLPVMEGLDDPVLVERLVSQLLQDVPDIVGIYSLGAGNRGLLRALKAFPKAKHMPVIAHELTPTARDALKSGHFDAVLNQDAGHEIRSAIRVMKAHADSQALLDAQERIRIDIFVKDNLP